LNICTNAIESVIEISNQLYLLFGNSTDKKNILLCDRGQYPTVKIADLGLAKIEAATKNNTFCGSPGYLAPECTQGPQAAGLNWAMDIYAVGVITYELYAPLI
jgi:serine/threonine protein kinase